jgi:hypothetical protein
MSIIIKDETANAVILTVDDNGDTSFGDGTPINRLTLDGYGVIDDDGHVVHGCTSSTVAVTSGSLIVPLGQQAEVDTLPADCPPSNLTPPSDAALVCATWGTEPRWKSGAGYTRELPVPLAPTFVLARCRLRCGLQQLNSDQ